MSTEEINSVSVRDTLSEDTLRIIQNLSNKTQKLSSLWKQVYHMTGRTHFFATDIIAEWEEGAKTEYFSGETIDFSKLHVYLHKDDEYTLEDENQIEETSAYVPSITVVPEVSEDKVVKITISYGSGSETISTTVNITAKKVTPMPIDLDYYEGYGYSNYDGELLPKDNSTCCFTNVEFTNGVEGSMTFYPNDCVELSNVDSDCQVIVPTDIGYKSETKTYDLIANIRYHPIVNEIYNDSNHAEDYNFVYIPNRSEQTANISINRSSYDYQYTVHYHNGKYTAMDKHGSLAYSEDDMPIGLHTRNVIISLNDGTTLEKEITIKIANPIICITKPPISWVIENKITCDGEPLHTYRNSDDSVDIYYNSSYYSIDNPNKRTLLNSSSCLLKSVAVPSYRMLYIKSKEGITDIDGNNISIPKYKYYCDDGEYITKYIAVDSNSDIIMIYGNKSAEKISKDLGTVTSADISFDGELNIGDEVLNKRDDNIYTVTRVLPDGARWHKYRYIITEEYLAWAEENGFVIVES